MDIREVKCCLNQIVFYTDVDGIEKPYKLTGCMIRKNDDGFFYQAELQDITANNSLIYCSLIKIYAAHNSVF